MVGRTVMVAGGGRDPNIRCVMDRLTDRGVDHLALLIGSSPPKLTWTLGGDRLSIGGMEVAPRAVFLRYDVFTFLSTGQPESRRHAARWYHAVQSWVLSHEETAFLNRRYGTRQVSKPYVLTLARRLGLEVPDTIVSSDPTVVLSSADDGIGDAWIVKPIDGGEYTRVLSEAVMDGEWVRRSGASPSIIQRRLLSPDLRIYRVGEAWFAFTLRSGEIDYRTDKAVSIASLQSPPQLVEPLRRLMDQLGLDFGAADFKTCPDTGRLLFLEVNSAPMFSAFDRVVDGALSDAIVDCLLSGDKTGTSVRENASAMPA
jgi:hypothetical protein